MRVPFISPAINTGKKITKAFYYWKTDCKLSNFEKIKLDLQDAIAKNPNNAPALYKYALGLYGMSYYGRTSYLSAYFQSRSDEFKYFKTKDRDKLPAVFQEYYGLYTAEKFFTLAAKAATTQTLKAKCIFGAAKYWQKRRPQNRDDDDKDSSYMVYSLANPYFKLLTYTKEIYYTCAYFKEYVKKN